MRKIDNGVFDFSTVSFIDNNWATLLMVAALLLLTVNAVVYRRKFLLSLRCLYSNRAFSQLSKEGKLFSEGSSVFSVPFILLTISLCIKQLCSNYFCMPDETMSYMRFFGLVSAGVAIFFLLRLIIDFVLFEVFDCPGERYGFHIMGFSFWLNISLVLLLTEVMVQYTKNYVFYLFTLLIISGLFLLKLYKNYVFKSSRVNLFQFFMYFCTLEILPYALIVKLLFLYGNKGF